ncbi:MAG: hypothetical protein Kow0089_22860 [Desulfobulbaceae bacterium]
MLLAVLWCFPVADGTAASETMVEKIASLALGMEGYTIGKKLSPEQKTFAVANLLDTSYRDTYSFSDGELRIVAAKQDDTVLALYQRNDRADFEEAKRIVSGLMGLYGNPTTMAHDQLIYWAYGSQGKIDEDSYNKTKGQEGRTEILATVKFSSDFPITDAPAEDLKGTVYFIISSDLLTSSFLAAE